MELLKTIADAMRRNNAGKLAVVVDSQYLVYDQKMVYVRLLSDMDDSVRLEFFISAVFENHTNPEIRVVETAASKILAMLESRTMFGVAVDGMPQSADCKVNICNELGLLVLESAVYCAVRKIAEREQEMGMIDVSSVILRFCPGDEREKPETVQKLLAAFKLNSLFLYKQLVYAGGSNRFISKLKKAYKFYMIQKSFVPLFIHCNLFYNPLNDGLVHKTVMYQNAVSSDRKVTVESDGFSLTGYFLTHEEICRSFRMKNFMRFTAGFWYSFFVGSLYPNAAGDFPVLGQQRWYAPKGLLAGKGLKTVYTDEEMAEQVQKCKKDSDSKKSVEMLEILALYKHHDTLFQACRDAHTKLTSFGPVSLDSKDASSVQAIYSYLCQARVEFV